jgi:hypothetical protein
VAVAGDYQPIYTARWGFRSPTTGDYKFATSHPMSPSTPLTDAARFCLRKAPEVESPAAPAAAECIGSGTVDQRGGSGGWLHIMGGVALQAGVEYEMVLRWDSRHGGFALADALLVESEAFLNDGQPIDTAVPLVVPPLDARIIKTA